MGQVCGILGGRTNRKSKGRFGLKREKEYYSSQNSLKGHESKVMSSLSWNMFMPQLEDSGPKRVGDFKYQMVELSGSKPH